MLVEYTIDRVGAPVLHQPTAAELFEVLNVVLLQQLDALLHLDVQQTEDVLVGVGGCLSAQHHGPVGGAEIVGRAPQTEVARHVGLVMFLCADTWRAHKGHQTDANSQPGQEIQMTGHFGFDDDNISGRFVKLSSQPGECCCFLSGGDVVVVVVVVSPVIPVACNSIQSAPRAESDLFLLLYAHSGRNSIEWPTESTGAQNQTNLRGNPLVS